MEVLPICEKKIKITHHQNSTSRYAFEVLGEIYRSNSMDLLKKLIKLISHACTIPKTVKRCHMCECCK